MMLLKQRINSIGLQILIGAVVGGLVSAFSTPVRAADVYGNTGIQFDVDTIVEFEFLKSNGAYQSTFGVINLDTGEKTPLLVESDSADRPQDVNRPSDFEDDTELSETDDFVGTPGRTVRNPLPEFQFQANTRYAFYLESTYNGRPAGILYSTDAQNPGSNQQARFEGNLNALLNGGSVIRWDDTGSVLVRTGQQDQDFDDFIVRVGGHEACAYGNGNNVSSKQQSKGDLYGSLQAAKCTGK